MIVTKPEFTSQPMLRLFSGLFAGPSPRSLVLGIVVCTFAFAAQKSVLAAPINYGSHVGTTVNYVDVTEDSTTSDPVPLFGAPVFSADSIDFNPVGFDASAGGAGGNDVTGSRLTFMVQAHPGKALSNISFSEAGDTTLAGAGTDSTATAVTATGSITISHVDGAAIAPVVQPIALTFTPSGGGYGLATDGGGGPLFFQQWSGSLFVNLNQVLSQAGRPFSVGATKISVDITNTLTASSQAGTMATINKKDFGGISITINIPEPASLALAAIAMAAVTLGRRSMSRVC